MKKKPLVPQALKIEASPTSFGIEFKGSEGLLRFLGNSYPENAVDFFQPLLQWVHDYVRIPRKHTLVEFRVNYFNTSSSKYLFQIMEFICAFHAKGNPVKVIWVSNEENNEMLDTWHEIMGELEMDYEVKSQLFKGF